MTRTTTAGWVLPLLVACGAPPATPDPGEAVVQAVGPAGGTLVARHEDGFTLTLDVPAGALVEDVTFTVEPLPPGAGLARFRLAPAGVVPALPVRLTVAADAALPEAAALAFDDSVGITPIPAEATASARTAELPILGFRDAGSPPTARTVGDDPGDTVISLAELSCEARVLELERRLDRTVALAGTPDAIARERLALRDLQLTCASEEVDRIRAATCTRYDAATGSLAALVVDDDATFRQVVGGLMQAKAAQELVDPEACDTAGYEDLVLAKIEQFVTLQEVLYRRTPFASDVEAHLDRVDDLFRYEVTCLYTGQEADTCRVVTRTLLPDVLDRLRRAAWEDCRASDSPFAVAELLVHPLAPGSAADPADPYFTWGRYTFGDLAGDVDHCAADAVLKVFADAEVAPTEIEAKRTRLRAGEDVGARVVLDRVALPAGGSLAIADRLPAPPCPGAGGRGLDGSLVARVNGVELDRVTRDGDRWVLGPGALEVLADDALAAAGLPETGGAFVVTVRREDGSCPSYAWPETLFEIPVSVGVPAVRIRVLRETSFGLTEVKHTEILSVDCDDEDYESSETFAAPVPAGGAELPLALRVSGSTVAVDQPAVDRASVRVTTSLGPEIVDTCNDGVTTDFAVPNLVAKVYLVVEAVDAAALRLTSHPRWAQPTPWHDLVAGAVDGASREGTVPTGGDVTVVLDAGRELHLPVYLTIVDRDGVSLADEELFGVRVSAPPAAP